jgi:hypothetical protein
MEDELYTQQEWSEWGHWHTCLICGHRFDCVIKEHAPGVVEGQGYDLASCEFCKPSKRS